MMSLPLHNSSIMIGVLYFTCFTSSPGQPSTLLTASSLTSRVFLFPNPLILWSWKWFSRMRNRYVVVGAWKYGGDVDGTLDRIHPHPGWCRPLTKLAVTRVARH
ncbi:hypothetical protein EDB85DRAFT_1563734 [Lactarius pseudohatsudake]|nr:hypothetical protein EDB85DRAFT_1563734 [Lactarius pseudohatsudake]